MALWGLAKKKPLALVRQSHGTQGAAQDLQQPYWVSAVAALLNSDLVATGAWCWESCVLFWQVWGPVLFLVLGCVPSLLQVPTVAV